MGQRCLCGTTTLNETTRLARGLRLTIVTIGDCANMCKLRANRSLAESRGHRSLSNGTVAEKNYLHTHEMRMREVVAHSERTLNCKYSGSSSSSSSPSLNARREFGRLPTESMSSGLRSQLGHDAPTTAGDEKHLGRVVSSTVPAKLTGVLAQTLRQLGTGCALALPGRTESHPSSGQHQKESSPERTIEPVKLHLYERG